MAVWRKKAYSTFGLPAGSYSYAEGKKFLFRDLAQWAREAIRENDVARVQQICDYVVWADAQRTESLDAVIDLAFFAPLFEDEQLTNELSQFLPSDLLARMQLRLEIPPDDPC